MGKEADEPMSKRKLLERMQTARTEWDALLATIPKARLTEAGVDGDWSLKDVIAHLSWYEPETTGVLQKRELTGSKIWDLPQDERNVAIYKLNQHRELDEVLATSQQTFRQLVEAVETLSEEDLHDPARFKNMPDDWRPWQLIRANSYEHYEDHISDVRAWLARSASR